MSPQDVERIVCPQCSAKLPVAEGFCPQCGARIDPGAPDASGQPDGPLVAPQAAADRPQRRWDVAESRGAVLALLFAALGPLAFPVLWRSSKFSLRWKVVLTIVVGILTCVVVWLLWYVIHMFVDALGEAGIIARAACGLAGYVATR